MRKLINKLNVHYCSATLGQHVAGLSWYREAYEAAWHLSNAYSIPVFKIVGVIAALSPNNKWHRNLTDTKLLLDHGEAAMVSTYPVQKHKALRILQAKDVFEVKEILRGEKTSNFFDNIWCYEFSQKVTVDLWMYRAAGLKPSPKNFKKIHNAVLSAAKQFSVLPHQYQAVVWSVVRTTGA